jgi:hypothetical protein
MATVSSTPRSRAGIGLGVLLLAYGAILLALMGAVPSGSDNSGYFNEARLFARLEIQAHERVLPGLPAAEAPPYLYVPLGFRPSVAGPGLMVPTYPPGLPLMLAPVAHFASWRYAGDIVLLFHSLAGLALVYALGRRFGLPPPWALLGSLVLAASPLYLFTSLQALSDVPATAWAAAAVLAAWKSRERSDWALAAGVCFSVALLIRPSNFLLAAPIAIAVGLSPRCWILGIAGALPGIALSLAINQAAYGGYLQSGYGAIGNEFHSSLVSGTLAYAALWLPMLFSPVVIVAPAVAVLFRARPRVAGVLLAWAAAYIAFYSAYRWTHESWWFLRFLLPASPALIVAGLLVLHLCFEGLHRRLSKAQTQALLILLVFAALGAEVSQIARLEAWSIGRGERKYSRVAGWLAAHVPANSVIIVSQFSGAAYFYTDYTFLRGNEIDPAAARRIQDAVRAGGRPLYAVLFPFELDMLGRVPGKWANAGTIDDVTVFRRDGDKP